MTILNRARKSFNAALTAWRLDAGAGDQVPLVDEALELYIGIGLISLLEPSHGGDLLERIGSFRSELLNETGKTLPPVRIRDDARLCDECFVIKVRGTQVVNNHVALARKLAVDSSFQDDYLNGTGVLELSPVSREFGSRKTGGRRWRGRDFGS